MNIILFDTPDRENLFPLTLTRAVADLRMGIFTIRERWTKLLGAETFVATDSYLRPLYQTPAPGEYLFIDSSVIPGKQLIEKIKSLVTGEAIADENGIIAGRLAIDRLPALGDLPTLFEHTSTIATTRRLNYPFEMFQWNGEMLAMDFELIRKGRLSHGTNDTVHLVKSTSIFIEEDASIDFSVLNASSGPIYIGRNTTIMEGSYIRGPFALCEGAVLKMGTRIYGATTIGPYSVAGGEIKNSIITGYSNKAHEGYLGDSIIGEWCNLGAGTSNSNVKNTASTVSIWNYPSCQNIPAGNKCGVIMGDYTRTAINSSINTGSVIGISCNVFGEGLLPKFLADFTWGCKGVAKYDLEKAMRDIDNWKKMKNKTLSVEDRAVLQHIFERNGKNSI